MRVNLSHFFVPKRNWRKISGGFVSISYFFCCSVLSLHPQIQNTQLDANERQKTNEMIKSIISHAWAAFTNGYCPRLSTTCAKGKKRDAFLLPTNDRENALEIECASNQVKRANGDSTERFITSADVSSGLSFTKTCSSTDDEVPQANDDHLLSDCENTPKLSGTTKLPKRMNECTKPCVNSVSRPITVPRELPKRDAWSMLSWRSKKTNDALQHTDDIVPSFVVEYLPNQCGEENMLPSNDVALHHVKEPSKHYFTAVECPVITSRELRTNTDAGSTLHLELDISSHKGIRYETADELGVLPVNNISFVEAVAKALQFDLDAVFQLKPSPKKEHKFQSLFPTPCTVRWCLLHYCDLTTPPSRSQLGLLANHATNTSDKNSLQLMASFSKLGQKEYKQKISDPRIGMAEIVSVLCPSVNVSFEMFIFLCARLQPRFYAISSSSSLYPLTIHLTVNVARGIRKSCNSEWNALCSGYLSNIPTGGTCRAFIKPSSFRLPSDVSYMFLSYCHLQMTPSPHLTHFMCIRLFCAL